MIAYFDPLRLLTITHHVVISCKHHLERLSSEGFEVDWYDQLAMSSDYPDQYAQL